MNVRRLLGRPIGVELLGQHPAVDVYARNGLRLLGLSAAADDAAVRRACSRHEALQRLAPARAQASAIALGYETRVDLDAEQAAEAVGQLMTPAGLLLARLFWLPATGAAEALLPQGLGTPELVRVLEEQVERSRHADDESLRALAVTLHNQAIAQELARAERPACALEPPWKHALTRWADVLAHDAFSQRIPRQIEELDLPELSRPEAAELVRNLPRFLLGVNVAFAAAYAGDGRVADCRRHVDYMRASGLQQEAVTEAITAVMAEILATRMAPLAERAREELRAGQGKLPRPTFQERCDRLLEQAAKVLRDTASELDVDTGTIGAVELDEFIEVVWKASEQLEFQGPDRVRNLLYSCCLLRRLCELPMSAPARLRVEKVFRESMQALYSDFSSPGTDPTECFFAPGLRADPDASLLIPVHKVFGNAFLSTHVAVPRSREAATCHGGGTVMVATAPRDFGRRERRTQAKIEAIERDFRKRLDEIESERRTALAAETSLLDSQRSAVRDGYMGYTEEQQRARDAELAGMERERAQLVEAGTRAAQALDEERRQALRAPQARAERAAARTGTLQGWLHIEMPWLLALIVASAVVAPYFIGTTRLAMAPAPYLWVPVWITCTLCLGLVRRRQRRRRALVGMERIAHQFAMRATRLQREQEQSLEELAQRDRDIEARRPRTLAEREAEVVEASSRRVDELTRDFDARAAVLEAAMAENTRKLRETLVRPLKPRPEKDKYRFPPYLMAMQRGFKHGARPG